MWLISRTCSRSAKKPNTTSNQPLRRKNDKLSSKRRCLSSLFSCCKLSPVSHLQVDIKLPRNGNMQFNRGSAAVKFYEIDYNDSVVFRRTHRLLTKVIVRVRMKNNKTQGFWVVP